MLSKTDRKLLATVERMAMRGAFGPMACAPTSTRCAYARNPLWSVPRPGHPAFIGPVAQPRGTGYFDPRPNVPGVTHWGD